MARGKCFSNLFDQTDLEFQHRILPVTMSEEQQAANELVEFGSSGGKALMGESWECKAPRTSAPECLTVVRLHVYH